MSLTAAEELSLHGQSKDVGDSFTRDTRAARLVKGLFWKVWMGFLWDIALNILLFIPLVFLLGGKGWKAILFGFLLSTFIELTQYAFLFCYFVYME